MTDQTKSWKQHDGPSMYRLHWAGTRTTDGTGNCGREADFLVAANDVYRLAHAAGGFGVRNQGIVR